MSGMTFMRQPFCKTLYDVNRAKSLIFTQGGHFNDTIVANSIGFHNYTYVRTYNECSKIFLVKALNSMYNHSS